MLDPKLADELRTRPEGRRVMTQRWGDLCFVHYSFDPSVVQASLPAGLTVDTFPDANGRERAWVGLVPFRMQEVRFARGVGVPTAVNFLETNVRTYVHRGGAAPGVWFYSLEASSRLAVSSARSWFGLPYWFASMSYGEAGQTRSYEGQRRRSGPGYRMEIEVGETLAAPELGSLEFFLLERYLLYSEFRGQLRTGRVFHRPYPVQSARVLKLEEGLVAASGFEAGAVESVLFSPGVDVEVFGLG